VLFAERKSPWVERNKMKAKNKKRILIIVHGVWRIYFKNKLLDAIEFKILDPLTDSRSMKREDYHRFAEFLKEDYDKIIFFRWSGKPYGMNGEFRRLSKMLEKYKKEQIDIIAVSLGGKITYKALLNSPKIKINKLLYIGAIHDSHKKLKNVKKIINVYSNFDKLFFLANNFYVGLGNAFLRGVNVCNKPLENFRHDELLLNKPLKNSKIREKSLYDYYRNLLLGD